MHQEEVLRIPKHPQVAKFGLFWAKLWHFKENGRSPKIWGLNQFWELLCFLLFSWSILIRKLMFGGVSESSGSPLVDGHRDFQNRCRNGWENWSWSWQPSFGKWQTVRKLISVFKVPTSTSIFSAISASILKISVPINKRRSWRFQNTPRSHLSDEY